MVCSPSQPPLAAWPRSPQSETPHATVGACQVVLVPLSVLEVRTSGSQRTYGPPRRVCQNLVAVSPVKYAAPAPDCTTVCPCERHVTRPTREREQPGRLGIRPLGQAASAAYSHGSEHRRVSGCRSCAGGAGSRRGMGPAPNDDEACEHASDAPAC
eukprot:scaffold158_cov388-Prasinococcus_capsulatus_cf.AAC.4